MENNDDEKHFEFLVYGQREPNQYAKMQFMFSLIKWGRMKYWYMPVQDNTELEDGDADHLCQSIFIRQRLNAIRVVVPMASVGVLSYFLQVRMIMIMGRGVSCKIRFWTMCCVCAHGVSVRIYSRRRGISDVLCT